MWDLGLAEKLEALLLALNHQSAIIARSFSWISFWLLLALNHQSAIILITRRLEQIKLLLALNHQSAIIGFL